MIKHVWSVLCRSASFDTQTNSVSLLNTIEAITVLSDLDATHPIIVQAELVSLWQREQVDTPISGRMRLYVTDPNGTRAEAISLAIDLNQSPFHRTRINIPGLPISAYGMYYFNVEYQVSENPTWSLAASIPLLVLAQEPQPNS